MTDLTDRKASVPIRLSERVEALRGVGVDGEGVSRLAYTPEEREAHTLFAEWAQSDGAEVWVDEAGNSVATFRPGEPFVLLGSHLDTVRRGGAYDGAAGVLVGLEVARARQANAAYGVKVVAFAGEEGARFGRPNLGSALAAGLFEMSDAQRLRDADDMTLLEAAHAVDLSIERVNPWLSEQIGVYLEVHIEQGRILEDAAASIGLVDAIAGSVRLKLSITGESAHSGATPMRRRYDALAGASAIVLSVERLGRRHRGTVATVGRLSVYPNNVTTVPGGVECWVDIRDVDGERQRECAREILDAAREIASTRGLRLSVDVLSSQGPVVLAAWPRVVLAQACADAGIAYRVLSSGAGHDAAIVARRAPACMVFVPCARGVSHAPEEHASIDDLALATEVCITALEAAESLM